MAKMRRLRAVLGVDKEKSHELLSKANAVYNGFSNNPALFATPNPSLPILKGKIQAFYVAQQAVGTGLKGAAAVRDVKGAELITALESGKMYVQELCDASPEQAAALIAAAAMSVGQAPSFTKPVLQAKQRAPGSAVQVIANVGVLTEETTGKVFFNWQVSVDGGVTWGGAPSTPRGRTEITGLTPLTTCAFRVSVTDANGTGVWSQAVTLLVL